MTRDGDTQLARSPALLLRYADKRGLDRGELLQAASLAEDDLVDLDARIPVVAMHRLWRAVLDRDDDPIIGLKVGATVTVQRMGLVGYVMNYSDTLLSALLNLSRYSRLISDASQFRVTERQDEYSLEISTRPYMTALRQPIASTVASLMTIARQITRSELTPLSAHLPIPAPADPEPYRVLLGDKLYFDSPVLELRFAPEQMALPTRAGDSTLGGYLDELAEAKLRELSEHGTEFIDRVRRGIWANLQKGRPSLHRTAASVGMSPRTLQRRLGEHGTSFSAVLEELRRELSEELRRNRGFAVSEVALLLGYSEPSAYLRAVRRWGGDAHRQRLVS